MRPVDGSISINRLNVPDNKPIDSGKSMALDWTGKAEHYPCLDDCVPHENVFRIREARALRRPHPIESALIKPLLSPILSTVLHGHSNSDSGLEA